MPDFVMWFQANGYEMVIVLLAANMLFLMVLAIKVCSCIDGGEDD